MGNTVKFVALLRVILLVVIEILPVVAPVGTFVVRLAAVAVSVCAVMLLKNLITLFSGALVLKFVPVSAIVAPTAPLEGVKLVKVGVGNTVKSVALVPVIPPTVTVILPVVAPFGTVVVMLVCVAVVTTAVTSLNFTTLFASVL